MFLMQVAGLRKGSNWQDTQWGIFMSKYIFPGADGALLSQTATRGASLCLLAGAAAPNCSLWTTQPRPR